jgi:hypothetical protein
MQKKLDSQVFFDRMGITTHGNPMGITTTTHGNPMGITTQSDRISTLSKFF